MTTTTAAADYARFIAASQAAASVAALRDAAPKYMSGHIMLRKVTDEYAALSAATRAAYSYAMKVALACYLEAMAETAGFDLDTVDYDASFAMIDKIDRAEIDAGKISTMMSGRDFDPAFFTGIVWSIWGLECPIVLTPAGRAAADAAYEANF